MTDAVATCFAESVKHASHLRVLTCDCFVDGDGEWLCACPTGPAKVADFIEKRKGTLIFVRGFLSLTGFQ